MVSGKNSGGEKWRKSWTHSPRHPRNNTSHHWPHHRTTEHIFIAITMFSRGLGALREQRPPSQGGQWGARWGTPGSKVGSRVGNPGERGGEPQGAGWGAPGSGVGNPRERGGEHCEGTPSGSHSTTLKKTKDLQNGHTRESLTPERKLPSTSSTLHISLVKHSTGSTIVDTHQARTETPTTTKHHTIRAQLCTPYAS